MKEQDRCHYRLGIVQTGTGKTAAFTLPILAKLTGIIGAEQKRGIRVLVAARRGVIEAAV